MSFKGLVTGVSGLQAQSKKMEVIGNNLANINTAGYKRSRVNFAEAYSDVMKQASGGDGGLIGGTNPQSIGSGVNISSITKVFSQGNRLSTGRNLDFMIDGDDFFAVKNSATEQLMLTRNGNFGIDANTLHVVDAFGNKVMGFNVDAETGDVDQVAGMIQIPTKALAAKATSLVEMNNNLDAKLAEVVADNETLGWEVFSAGENFGNMGSVVAGGSGIQAIYGDDYYRESQVYSDDAATLVDATDTITLSATPTNFHEGFEAGDVVNLIQGTEQIQATIASNTAGVLTFEDALPAGFTDGAVTVTNLSNAASNRGSSGTTSLHNDILNSQIAMVDKDGKLIASFYRVSGEPSEYITATATDTASSSIKIGTGEFSNVTELTNLIGRALRDGSLTNGGSSTNLDIDLDKYGRISFGGTGLVQEFRLVVNADNTEMLDRFDDIAITDNGATATTQARLDANNQVIASPALGLAARTTHASKPWYSVTGLETYGYNANTPATEYGEYAGLRFEGGAQGTGYGGVQLSLVNGLGDTVTKEFRMVPRSPDKDKGEFTNMGELARLVQNTLRTAEFSSLADAGTLVSDESAKAVFQNGRFSVNTTSGVFQGLSIKPINDDASQNIDVTRTDYTNFGTVLGELAEGVNGKSATSNQFIQADARVQAQIFDSQGNEHTAVTYFVKDRSTGLENVEWKFKASLGPNLNTFASEDPKNPLAYANTFNSIADSANVRGVLAFDMDTGAVLTANASGSDSRYSDAANLTFTPQEASKEAAESSVTIDFAALTSYEGSNSINGHNVDGHTMGELIRITTEQVTGNINGIYSNDETRTLGKVGLMSITNPEGLEKMGSSYYLQSPNTSEGGVTKGVDQIYWVGAEAPTSSDGVRSKIHGKTLEASNVDLTEELTEMIVTQRSYSASGKIITSTDEMLQEALNLKR